MNCGVIKPIRMPSYNQRWFPTPNYPYPMNFTDAPNPLNQIYVSYMGSPMIQGLDRSKGPIMFPRSMIRNSPIMYPTTHSLPGPYLQSYIALVNRC